MLFPAQKAHSAPATGIGSNRIIRPRGNTAHVFFVRGKNKKEKKVKVKEKAARLNAWTFLSRA